MGADIPEVGPSTVTELQHPEGSPQSKLAIGCRNVHRSAQCRRACNSERPTSDRRAISSIRKVCLFYGIGFTFQVRRRWNEGVATSPPISVLGYVCVPLRMGLHDATMITVNWNETKQFLINLLFHKFLYNKRNF